MSEASFPHQSPPLNFDLETVREVAALLRESQLGEICIETTNEDAPPARLLLRRATSAPPPAISPPEPATEQGGESATGEDQAASTPAFPTTQVTAPAVGVFRPAKTPVKEGDVVKAGQAIGCVESMRVPNEIVAPVAGQVREARAGDGQGVEYGQVLFVIEEAP